MYSSVTWVIFLVLIASLLHVLFFFLILCASVMLCCFHEQENVGGVQTNFVTFILVFVSVTVKIQPKLGKTSSTGSKMSYQNIGKVIPNQLFLPNNLFSLHSKTERKVLVASDNLHTSCGV